MLQVLCRAEKKGKRIHTNVDTIYTTDPQVFETEKEDKQSVNLAAGPIIPSPRAKRHANRIRRKTSLAASERAYGAVLGRT